LETGFQHDVDFILIPLLIFGASVSYYNLYFCWPILLIEKLSVEDGN